MESKRADNLVTVDGAFDDALWPPEIVGDVLGRQIADHLGSAIIEGRIASGTRLSEVRLAERFGVSRTPIREAVQLLERDELVERLPRRGARVTHLRGDQAQDVFVCLAHIYGLSARLAVSQFSAFHEAEFNKILSNMSLAVDGDDLKGYFELSVKLHHRVGELAGNQMLLKVMEGMGRLTVRFRFLSMTIPGRLPISLAAHARLVKELAVGNPDRVEDCMREVVADAGDAVLLHFFGDPSAPVHKIIRSWKSAAS